MNEGWSLTPLGEILKKSEEWIDINPERRYKQITVKIWGKGVIERNEVSGAEISGSKRLKVKAGEFIVSRIDARHGAFGLIPDFLEGAIVTNDFPIFKPKSNKILPKYLDWMSKTRSFVDLCVAASEGTTNRVRLKEDRFLSMQIPLPPLDEQRRIVARIEELAAKVEEARGLRRQSIEEAEALKKSAMSQVFKPHDKYQEVPLESVCAAIIDNLHSNPVYADVGVPCVRSSDVGWGVLYLETARRTSEDEYKQRTVRGEPTPDDIVLVREGGGTGKVAIVQKGQRFSLGQRVMMLRPDKSVVLPKFCLYQFLSPSIYEDQILPHCKGSASPHLNIGKLRRFVFFLPPLLEQHRIVAYLDDLQSKVDALKRLQTETAAELDALLPSILDKAFKGEL
jgi:type I restriction enzyme S subunit